MQRVGLVDNLYTTSYTHCHGCNLFYFDVNFIKTPVSIGLGQAWHQRRNQPSPQPIMTDAYMYHWAFNVLNPFVIYNYTFQVVAISPFLFYFKSWQNAEIKLGLIKYSADYPFVERWTDESLRQWCWVHQSMRGTENDESWHSS